MDDTSLYRPILKRAWQIAMKYKNLWFFGLFAGIIGVGGEYEILQKAITTPQNYNDSLATNFLKYFLLGKDSISGLNLWQAIKGAFMTDPWSIIIPLSVIAIGIIIFCFFIWLSVISEVGLISGISSGNKNKKITINDGLTAGVSNLWPVLSINVILKILFWIIIFGLGKIVLLFIISGMAWWQLAIYYLLFVAAAIIIFSISFLLRYQIMFLVLKKETFIDSFKSSLSLFIPNWLISIEMAFIIFFISLITLILSALIGIFIWNIVLITVPGFFANHMPLIIIQAIYALLLLILVACAMAINAFITTYIWSAWILLFNRITSGEETAKLLRVGQKIPYLNRY